jgi:pentatricopeptide repeat protein
VLERREDYSAVVDLLERRVDLTDDSAERIEILRRLARVYERRLDLIDEAVAVLRRILEISPSLDTAAEEGGRRTGAYGELERLFSRAERWHELVELHEQAAAAAADQGAATAEVRHLAAAADVWEGPLENPEAAGEILEKILEREPEFVPALTRLARIYERGAAWDRCSEILEQALALGPTGTDAAELHVRRGEVALASTGDVEAAALAFRSALDHDRSFLPAIDALAAHGRETEDRALLAEMLGRRYQHVEAGPERRALAIELAELYTRWLGQPEAMTAVLEEEAREAPDDPEVLGALADAYSAARRFGDAAPIYSKLAETAKKSRRMKDVARYRVKAAELLEEQGDIEGAQAAYEEAFRIDPTNVGTMAGLGRIYLSSSEWEKARRVYRSMVLQSLEPDIGITKADVYYNLGYIHAQLGEINKARGMMQRGLELDPDHERIIQALAAL